MSWLTLLLVCAPLLAGHAPSPPMPRYPSARPIPIEGPLEAEGQRLDVAYFTTPDPPAQVADFYERAWAKLGVPVTREGGEGDGLLVASLWTLEAVTRAVVARRHGEQTLVFEVVARPHPRRTHPEESP